MIKFGYEAFKNSSPYSATSPFPPAFFHQATFYKITYIENGDTKIEFISRKTKKCIVKECAVGDMFIITPEDIHRYDVNDSDKYRHRDVYATPELMKLCCDFVSPDLYDEINDAEYPLIFKISANEMLALGEKLSVFINNQPSKWLDAIHKSILVSLLGIYRIANTAKNLYPDWIQELLKDLENLEIIKLPLEQIVSRTNYSHSYVCRTFKKYLGVTLKQYINDRKLELSAVMIQNSDKSIENIALSLELGILTNYIRAFKKRYGVSPGRYRQEFKEKQTSSFSLLDGASQPIIKEYKELQ